MIITERTAFQTHRFSATFVKSLTFTPVVRGEFAIVGDNHGEGYSTSIYRKVDGAWHWVADKGNAPGRVSMPRRTSMPQMRKR